MTKNVCLNKVQNKEDQRKQILKFLVNTENTVENYALTKYSRFDENTIGSNIPSDLAESQLENNQNSKVRKFFKYFTINSTQGNLESYLDRIQSIKELVEHSVLEVACYFYAKICRELGIDGIQFNINNAQLLTFGVCINIAQKYMLDKDIHPDCIEKLLGIKKKQLYQREAFIYSRVFDCCLNVQFEEFVTFCDKLYSL